MAKESKLEKESNKILIEKINTFRRDFYLNSHNIEIEDLKPFPKMKQYIDFSCRQIYYRDSITSDTDIDLFRNYMYNNYVEIINDFFYDNHIVETSPISVVLEYKGQKSADILISKVLHTAISNLETLDLILNQDATLISSAVQIKNLNGKNILVAVIFIMSKK